MLTGSEKQVAWAERIRHKELKSANEWYQKFKQRISDPAELEKCERTHAVAHKQMVEQSSAKWWIDEANGNGDMTLRQLMQEVWKQEDQKGK